MLPYGTGISIYNIYYFHFLFASIFLHSFDNFLNLVLERQIEMVLKWFYLLVLPLSISISFCVCVERLGDEYFSWWYVQHMLPYGTGSGSSIYAFNDL